MKNLSRSASFTSRSCNSAPRRGATSCSACGRRRSSARPAPEAEAYAEALVAAEASANATELVFSKVKADFEAAGVDQSDHQIRRTLDELLEKAKAEAKG